MHATPNMCVQQYPSQLLKKTTMKKQDKKKREHTPTNSLPAANSILSEMFDGLSRMTAMERQPFTDVSD